MTVGIVLEHQQKYFLNLSYLKGKRSRPSWLVLYVFVPTYSIYYDC